MISYLNEKYGIGCKTFLEIIDSPLRNDIMSITNKPNPLVKKLISETLDKYNKECGQPVKFRN